MDALCDSCGKAFAVWPRARRDGDIETTFFACAHCGHEYVVCKTESRTRDLGAQVTRQRQRNGDRQRQGGLTRRHIGHMKRKVNQFRAVLDALNMV